MLIDQSSFSKYEIAGPGAFAALQRLAANPVSILAQPVAERLAFAVGHGMKILLLQIDEAGVFHGLLLMKATSSPSVVTPSRGLTMSANCDDPTSPTGAKSFTVS